MTIQERMNDAKQGRTYWLELVNQYGVNESTYVLLIPNSDGRYSDCFLKYLPEFMDKKRIQKAIVLTMDPTLLDMSTDNISFLEIGETEVHSLMQFYCLYEFAPNFIIASLDMPASRRGKGYINKGGITMEEIFKAVVFGLTEN